MTATIAVIAVLAWRASPVAAEPLPRVAHLTAALAAVRALGPDGRDQLDRALYATARTQCHADTGTPTASCLIAAGRAACADAERRAPIAGGIDRAGCEAAADVIAANLRASTTLVDEATRMRLVRGSTDYHAALAAEVHRRTAMLAAELALDGAGGDAAAIDQLCARRDRAIHACAAGDASCVPSLPWSRCAAALVWFVGGGR